MIPIFEDSIFCDYKFILPDGYINLGLEDNILTKKSDTVYTFYGQCPTRRQADVIKYSPEKVTLMANLELSLTYPPKFTEDVNLIIPRYFIGGKLKNSVYELYSLENELYNENNYYIYDDTIYVIQLKAVNKEKIGIKLHTVFTNNLNDEFKVYFPESHYEIDISKIPQEIIDKAKEIISQESDKPNYYKIGKFIRSYITYDDSYSKKNLTLKQIYDGRTGASKHYTLLYNAMLNAVGIKTLYISGLLFIQNKTLPHIWTAALIDGKWAELDATFNFFERIPATHIIINFGQDFFNYQHYETEPNQISSKANLDVKIISIGKEQKISDKYLLRGGIALGICFILYVLFCHNNRKNKNKLHSELIEEIKVWKVNKNK